jgi:ribosomal protein L1
MRRVSRRYKEIKEKILSDRVYPISEGLEFVKNNNTEKSKNIRVSFTLNWRNQKNVLKGKTILPNFTSRKDKMVVIENGLSSDTLETINSKNNVFSSSVEDLLRIITEKRKNT